MKAVNITPGFYGYVNEGSTDQAYVWHETLILALDESIARREIFVPLQFKPPAERGEFERAIMFDSLFPTTVGCCRRLLTTRYMRS